MKERSVKAKVRPKRLTRAERKRIKRSQKADAQLALCRQAIEFHKAYLAIEMEYEQANYDELKARLDELKAIPAEQTIETVETVETVEIVEPAEAEETDMFAKENLAIDEEPAEVAEEV